MDFTLQEHLGVQGLTIRFAVRPTTESELQQLQSLCSPHAKVRHFVPDALARTWSHARRCGDVRGCNALAMDGLLADQNDTVFLASPEGWFHLSVQCADTALTRMILADLHDTSETQGAEAFELADLLRQIRHLHLEAPIAPFVSGALTPGLAAVV